MSFFESTPFGVVQRETKRTATICLAYFYTRWGGFNTLSKSIEHPRTRLCFLKRHERTPLNEPLSLKGASVPWKSGIWPEEGIEAMFGWCMIIPWSPRPHF